MEDFKLKIYSNSNNGSLLQYYSLNKMQASELIKKIISQPDIAKIKNTQDLFITLKSKLKNKITIEKIDEKEGLAELFYKTNIKILNDSSIFIIWDYPENVDEFSSKYLIQNWDFVWYGTSDDAIILYIPDQNKIFIINHWAEVYFN